MTTPAFLPPRQPLPSCAVDATDSTVSRQPHIDTSVRTLTSAEERDRKAYVCLPPLQKPTREPFRRGSSYLLKGLENLECLLDFCTLACDAIDKMRLLLELRKTISYLRLTYTQLLYSCRDILIQRQDSTRHRAPPFSSVEKKSTSHSRPQDSTRRLHAPQPRKDEMECMALGGSFLCLPGLWSRPLSASEGFLRQEETLVCRRHTRGLSRSVPSSPRASPV